jgi:enoyl-CoA hydratase/3-hydroxyacyl-CoA dehydrogenase
VIEDHELIDTAAAWAKRLAGQAPLAVAEIKAISNRPDLSDGIEAEKGAFERVFRSADGQEGIAAFLGKRQAQWKGE